MRKPLKKMSCCIAASALLMGCGSKDPPMGPDGVTPLRPYMMRINQPSNVEEQSVVSRAEYLKAHPSGLTTNTGAARIGRGYNSDRDEWLSNCVTPQPLASLNGGQGQLVFANTKEVTTMRDVVQNFGVSARAGLDVAGLFSGDLEFLLAQGSNISSYTTNVISTLTVQRQMQTMDRYELQPWVVERLNQDPSFADNGLADVCGDSFASGFQTGGELVFLMTKTYKAEQERTMLEASVKASMLGLVSASGSVDMTQLTALKNSGVTISVYSLGIVSQLPGLDDFAKKVTEFPLEVDRSGGWPIAVEVTPLKLVENYPNLSNPKALQVRRVLKELAERREAVLPIYNDDLFISLNIGKFVVALKDLQDSLALARQHLKLAEDAAVRCYGDERICEVPEFPPMPRRPWSKKDNLPPDAFYAALQGQLDGCEAAGVTMSCPTGLMSAECHTGQTVCERTADLSLQFGACTPGPSCLEEGLTRPCIADPKTDCPGTQRFSRGKGWGACSPTMTCDCKPGEPQSFHCDNGDQSHICGADHHWPGEQQCVARPETCNGVDDDLDGVADNISACHHVALRISNVDDDLTLWYDTTAGGNIGQAICRAKRIGNRNGEAECDLSAKMSERGNPDEARFIAVAGNGGCTTGSAHMQLIIDNQPVAGWDFAPKTIWHCSYFWRKEFRVNLRTGKLIEDIADHRCVTLNSSCNP